MQRFGEPLNDYIDLVENEDDESHFSHLCATEVKSTLEEWTKIAQTYPTWMGECHICYERTALRMACCRAFACEGCVYEWMASSCHENCFNCRRPFFPNSDSSQNTSRDALFDMLGVKMVDLYHQQSPKFVCLCMKELSILQFDHLNTCSHADIPCQGCRRLFSRGALENHQSSCRMMNIIREEITKATLAMKEAYEKQVREQALEILRLQQQLKYAESAPRVSEGGNSQHSRSYSNVEVSIPRIGYPDSLNLQQRLPSEEEEEEEEEEVELDLEEPDYTPSDDEDFLPPRYISTNVEPRMIRIRS